MRKHRKSAFAGGKRRARENLLPAQLDDTELQMNALREILKLDQERIRAGQYRDIDEFFAELDEDNTDSQVIGNRT